MKDTLLIADDDPDVTAALRYLLQTEGYEVSTAGSPAEVMALVKKQGFAAIVLDLNYSRDTTSGQEGLELIARITALEPCPSIIAMTAWGSIDTAVKAMQAGARDFVQKPWENERLLSIVANQVRLVRSERQTQKLQAENKLLRGAVDPQESLQWRSPLMQQVMDKLRQVAASDANLLLTGENGTGKSFLVNEVHRQSARKEGPLIKVNMGAIPENLFESEMFGHVKGAFTDARENRIGRFELAEEGTLFLDEIGNTPYSQQAKLLRVLEDHRFEKVGSAVTQQADYRLICASNCDLEVAVESGAFRRDLLFRINTIEIEVPPLRQRPQDIPVFADYFLDANRHKYNKPELAFSKPARLALETYPWPGNVRELAHAVERASILAESAISPEHLGLESKALHDVPGGLADWNEISLENIEKQIIAGRIMKLDGDKQEAARTLGLSRSAFYRKLRKHGLK